uniref:Flavocytochrome n=1 Tax=Hydrogenophilus thermoluteolus TaxID=297 RepID=Q08IS6_HYDTE|nr:flavocytochrome [Hydrogenophilus thermoluteolus]
MKQFKPFVYGAAAALAFALTPQAHAVEVDYAQVLANTCAGCHGPDGASRGPAAPTIAGMKPEIFIEAMQDYREDKRPGTIMPRIAKGYTDEQIKLMAEYFAKQPFLRFAQPHDAQLAAKGAKLHDRYCEKCHEDGGKASAVAGVLAGQWMPYLHYQLEDYLAEKREYKEKNMKKRLTELVEKEGQQGLEAVLHFYASQK